MPAPPADARSFRAEVTAVEPCGADGVLLRVAPELPLPPLRAARFFMLRREDGLSPAIPRPFSLYRQPAGELEFLIKVMGRGTRALGASRTGERLRVVGPLGNGWPDLDPEGPPLVMLAGGIGSVPFLLGIEQLLAGDPLPRIPAERITLIYGAATAELLYERASFEVTGVRTLLATDDGSAGTQGNVLTVLAAEQAAGRLPAELRLWACGPDPMLHAVERLAVERGQDAWLSLETLMGCGVGICNGCPVPTRPEGAFAGWPNAKCCVEGPVFSTRDVCLAAAAPAADHGSP